MIFDLHSNGYNYCKLGCTKASMQLRCETIRLVQWTSDEPSWRWMDFYIPNTKMRVIIRAQSKPQIIEQSLLRLRV